MFRAFYTSIIRSTISTVSTASGTNHSIISATFLQLGLVLTGEQLHLVGYLKESIMIHGNINIKYLKINGYCFICEIL